MSSYELAAMSLAATNLEKMREFYSKVFGIEFKQIDIGDGQSVYVGAFAGVEFALYRAEAGSPAGHNPMHFEIFFSDLQRVTDTVIEQGGRTNGKPMEDEEAKAIGVFDPDGNFMVFKQRK